MGWFQKEGLLFLPGNLQWRMVNSLYATTHIGENALQMLLERSFRGTGLQMSIRQMFLLSHLPIKQSPRSLKFQKNKQTNKHLFSFIDYTKTFDSVDHNKMWKILKKIGIPDHLTCLLRNLYAGQEATELNMEQQTGSK